MNDTVIFVLVIVGILGFVVVAFVIGRMMEKKRTAAMQDAANRLQIDFHPEDSLSLQVRFGNFNLFGQGHSKKLWNVFAKNDEGVEVFVFDYKYTIGHGKHSHTHNQTVVAVSDPELTLPDFTLGPESFFSKIGSTGEHTISDSQT